MHPRHAADAAARMARKVVPIFAPLLRDEELVDAYREVHDALVPEVERLLTAYDRMQARLAKPTATDDGETT